MNELERIAGENPDQIDGRRRHQDGDRGESLVDHREPAGVVAVGVGDKDRVEIPSRQPGEVRQGAAGAKPHSTVEKQRRPPYRNDRARGPDLVGAAQKLDRETVRHAHRER